MFINFPSARRREQPVPVLHARITACLVYRDQLRFVKGGQRGTCCASRSWGGIGISEAQGCLYPDLKGGPGQSTAGRTGDAQAQRVTHQQQEQRTLSRCAVSEGDADMVPPDGMNNHTVSEPQRMLHLFRNIWVILSGCIVVPV